MGFLKDLKRTYKNGAFFAFYELKDRVLELYNQAYNKGFSTPAYGDIEIARTNDGYDTIIHLYYKSQNAGKVQKFEKAESYGDLIDIPNLISDALKQKGKIHIKIENFQNLLAARDLAIKDAIQFNEIENFVQNVRVKNNISSDETSLTIIDELFYTRLIICFKTSIGQAKRYQAAFRMIKQYPQDILDELINSENNSVTLDI